MASEIIQPNGVITPVIKNALKKTTTKEFFNKQDSMSFNRKESVREG